MEFDQWVIQYINKLNAYISMKKYKLNIIKDNLKNKTISNDKKNDLLDVLGFFNEFWNYRICEVLICVIISDIAKEKGVIKYDPSFYVSIEELNAYINEHPSFKNKYTEFLGSFDDACFNSEDESAYTLKFCDKLIKKYHLNELKTMKIDINNADQAQQIDNVIVNI